MKLVKRTDNKAAFGDVVILNTNIIQNDPYIIAKLASVGVLIHMYSGNRWSDNGFAHTHDMQIGETEELLEEVRKLLMQKKEDTFTIYTWKEDNV